MTKLAVCSTLRIPLSQTLQFTRYHLNSGVDRMFLFFDDPEDPAINVLRDEPRVACIPCNEDHWKQFTPRPRAELSLNTIQRWNTSLALQLSRREGWDWLAHIDGDELIYSPAGIKRQLARVSRDIQTVKLTTLESVGIQQGNELEFSSFKFFKTHYPTRPGIQKDGTDFTFSGPQLFRYYANNFIHRQRVNLAKAFHVSRPFNYGFFKGHTSGKSIVRVGMPVEAMGCHYPIMPNGKLKMLLFSNSFVLHFDAPTFESWKTKWIRRYTGSARSNAENEMTNTRLDQYRRFVQIHDQGGDEKLKDFYEELFTIDPRDRNILLRLGLLRKIDFDRALFAPVKEAQI